MSDIILFGGTFDPPHLGHTSAALFAMRELKLDFVLMVVANDPWQKTDPNRIAAESDSCLPSAVNHRYEMTKIAVDEYEALIADDMEIIRGGKTYTIDTLMELNNRFSASEFFLLIGSDVAKDFHLWRDPQSICNNANVVVLNRPGVNLSEIDENWKLVGSFVENFQLPYHYIHISLILQIDFDIFEFYTKFTLDHSTLLLSFSGKCFVVFILTSICCASCTY